MMTIPIEIEHIEVDWTTGVLNGVVRILGVRHHARFIQVRVEDGLQVATDPEVQNELTEWFVASALEGHFNTVEVPGWDGKWLIFIHPGA